MHGARHLDRHRIDHLGGVPAGTDTVVLEAWGGDFSVEVSNEVTITC